MIFIIIGTTSNVIELITMHTKIFKKSDNVKCKEEAIPFHKQSNQQFLHQLKKSIKKDLDENSDLKIFPSPTTKSFFENLNGLLGRT